MDNNINNAAATAANGATAANEAAYAAASESEENVTKEFILDILKGWFNDGVFTTTRKIKSEIDNYSNATVESLCVARKMSYTSMQKVLFVGDKTRHPAWELFQRYYNEKRIMTPLEAKVQMNVASLHRLNKLVESGELLRFEFKDAIIYIQ